MLIYCFTITAILAFMLGFALGYFFGSSGNGKKPLPIKNVTYQREMSDEYAAFLSYDGTPCQNKEV